MSQKEKDDRFSKVYSDPRFRTFRKVDKFLKIDKRFKSMFTDDKFKLKYSMDKRGKNKKHLISDDYKKFYRLSDDEGDNKVENADPAKNNHQIDEPESQHSEAKEHGADSDVEDEDTYEVDKEGTPGAAVASKLTHKFGYHRGQNVASDDESSSSSSSSSESEESDEEDDVEVDHEWGELDRDAPQIENVTRRIAICNADWDRINAQDLLVLLNSFKRATGAIHFVRIYYSKFGEERLRVEERKGPTEFIFGKATKVEEIGGQEDDGNTSERGEASDQQVESEDENEEEDGGEGTDSAAIEKLRTYQLERLKYFYAIVEFDCAETAEVVYNELDGMEYETSSTTLDIRYVPEEMDFEDVKLKEECTSMPNSTSYKAPNFINTALQQSEVTLTWDETDHKRQSAFDRAFDKDHEDDLKAYLASSSDEEEEEDETVNLIDDNMKADEKINKYKDLLSSLTKDKEEDIEMEVTWDPSLKSTTENLIKNKQSGGKAGNLTANETGVPSSGEEEVHSDDSVDLPADDSEVEEKAKADSSKDKYKKWKKKRVAKREAALSKLSEDTSNLELLMVDMEKDGGSKKHFSYKEIVDNYNKKSSKSGDVTEKGDSFKFDAEDPRFTAIYSSHLYNIDQSDPRFKKTEAFDQILNKRKTKAADLIKDEKSTVAMTAAQTITNQPGKSWTSLVSKVKNKTGGKTGKRPMNNKLTADSKFNTNKKFRR